MKKFISVFAAGCVSLSATAQVFLPANALSPYYESFSYQSADELSEALEAGFSDDVIAEIESKETDSNKGAFRSFLNAVDECGMYIPVFDGEQLPYWSVSIQTHDMYKNTNIYYSYAVKESDVSYISIMYLDPEIKDSANINGVEWLKNQINPNGIDSEIQYPKYDSSNSLIFNWQTETFLFYWEILKMIHVIFLNLSMTMFLSDLFAKRIYRIRKT